MLQAIRKIPVSHRAQRLPHRGGFGDGDGRESIRQREYATDVRMAGSKQRQRRLRRQGVCRRLRPWHIAAAHAATEQRQALAENHKAALPYFPTVGNHRRQRHSARQRSSEKRLPKLHRHRRCRRRHLYQSRIQRSRFVERSAGIGHLPRRAAQAEPPHDYPVHNNQCQRPFGKRHHLAARSNANLRLSESDIVANGSHRCNRRQGDGQNTFVHQGGSNRLTQRDAEQGRLQDRDCNRRHRRAQDVGA